MNKILLFLTIAILMAGCGASPSNTDEANALRTKLPFIDASMTEGSTTKHKISVAVTSVSKDMQEKYFSDDVESHGYIPLLVTITNNASQDILVQSLKTTILQNDKEIKLADADLLKKKMRESVTTMPGINEPVPSVDNRYIMRISAVNMVFFTKALREDIIHSGQSVTGFIFFNQATYPSGDKKLHLEFQTLKKLQYFNIDANFNLGIKNKR